MRDEQIRNRNEWAQLTQYLISPQQQTYPPEDHAKVQGYAPIEEYAQAWSQDSHSDYAEATISSHGTYQTQEMNTFTVDDDMPEREVRDSVSSRRQKHKSQNPARPKEEQPKSKRAERREKVARENQCEVSASDRPKGLVEWREGIFSWYDPEDRVFLKAAYHDQYRDDFLREDRVEGTYVVAPECGKGANDITR